jgi:DNA-binding transcriptional LysR family regulator
VFEEFVAGLMVKRPRFGIDAGSNETIKQAVMAGLGIALISGHTVATELSDGRLAMLDVKGLPARRRWFAVRRSDKVLGPAAAALWQFIVEQGSTFLPALPGLGAPARIAGSCRWSTRVTQRHGVIPRQFAPRGRTGN